MRDDELRARSRGGAATTAERLRDANALTRAGRHDEALELLWPARHEALVRHAIGRMPAWAHESQASKFVDVRPIRSAADAAWVVPDPRLPRARNTIISALFASELGLVYQDYVDQSHGAILLDPATGKVRARLDGQVMAFDRELLVLSSALHARDPLTGDELGPAEPLPEEEHPPIVTRTQNLDRELAGASRDWRAPLRTVWQQPYEWVFSPWKTTRRRLIFEEHLKTRVLDRGTGESLFVVNGVGALCDERALVVGVVIAARPGTACYDLDGKLLWRRDGFYPWALTPSCLVVAELDGGKSFTVDRETGERLVDLEVSIDAPPGPHLQHHLAVARDVVYVPRHTGSVAAVDLVTGALLFDEAPKRGASRVGLLAPLAGRVFGVLDGGSVFCLAEATSRRARR